MRVLVTVECELSTDSPRDLAYARRVIPAHTYLAYDVTSVGEGGNYSLRQVRIRSMRALSSYRAARGAR